MCTVRPLVLFTALLASSAGQAASVIATPPLEYTGTAGESLECLVSNLGSDPAGVTIEFVNTSGTVAPGGPITILASGINSQFSSAVNPTLRYYCRVAGISKGKSRVTLCKRTPPSQSCAVAVTSP